MSNSGDYGSFDVKQLFHMIDAAKRDLPQTHQQIQAWQKTSEMLDSHADRLRGYRDDLAAQWPPERNEAAAAYLRHLDDLLSAVSKTASASAVNHWQLVHTVEAIEQAHKTLKPLYDEYVGNEKKLADYREQIRTAEATGSVAGGVAGRVAGGRLGGLVGDALGGFGAKAGMELFTSSPVPDGRQDHLNQQARAAMAALGGAAQDASSNMETPPPYDPPQVHEVDDAQHIGDSSTGGAHRPPVIAPPAHTRGSYLPEVSAPSGQEAPDLPSSPSAGPVLTGGTVGTLPASGHLPGTGNPMPSPTGSPMPGTVFGVPPVAGTPGVGATRVSGFGRPGGGPVTGPVARALPPGGVIGGAGGFGPAGRRGTAGAPRVNPVGGVLGQGGGGPAAVGGSKGGAAASRGGVGPGVLGGQRAGRRGGEGEERAWDPDNPWAVGEGVAPVIEPGHEPRSHDAGPGVIGIDR
ncbi:hypothetical protein ACNTMW_31850 [Planosporangium sp. 12N6]|uniref:flagellar export protein FliJ n=1 Tax=Planosporangium spinosum TaxID=3402278 RepID=UPI003CE99153